MTACSIVKEKILSIKYYILQYTDEEVFARKILSNRGADSVKDIGFLISASFMDSKTMNIALKVAFERLAAKENIIFSKHIQYYKSLLFLQKVCMESLVAKRKVLRNHRRILSFVFYTKDFCTLETSIRIASLSILKQINQEAASPSLSSITFYTCLSHTGAETEDFLFSAQTQED